MARRRSRSRFRRLRERLWLVASLIVLTVLVYLVVSHWYEDHTAPIPQTIVPDSGVTPE